MLRGFTVGITADRRWDEQLALFERRGATVVHGPAIRTLPLGAEGPLREATEAVIARPPEVLIANTGLGIRSWLGAADSWNLGEDLLRALRATRIYARGPKAAGVVHSAGLHVAGRSPTERLSEAVDLALEGIRPGQRVVLQVDGSGESGEVERLTARGADVVVVPVYLWKLPEDRKPALRLAEGVIAGRVHAVTFTAGPALRNWVAIAGDEGIGDELGDALNHGSVVLGCVGPVCTEAAVAAGIDPGRIVMPDVFRLGPLVRAVADALVAQAITVEVGGNSLVITGNVATIDGEAVTLTDTEARLLATLARKPNVVFTKEHLLRAVWGSETEDPHAVEVGVARLRRRLGTHGRAVASVHRRGYTLRG